MHSLERNTRNGRLAALLFAVLWLSTWFVTVMTWEKDAAGFSIGMAPIAIPLHLLLPLILGLLPGLIRHDASPWKSYMLTGAIFAIAHFFILSLVDLLWLPAVKDSPPLAELAAGTLVGAVVYAAVCVVLSLLGGWIGRMLFRP